ncbi:MAG: hypothetical protein FJ267_12400 [Planctomycetes bacterium]|nr:hypothetical protein [Planctomycetota bacterium]
MEVDELIEVQIVVTNTGTKPLSDVRIVASIPNELRHREGNDVEYTVGNLPVRGSHQCVLRLVAHSPGKPINRLQVVSHEKAEDAADTPVTVITGTPKKDRPPLPHVVVPEPYFENCTCPGQPVASLFEVLMIP